MQFRSAGSPASSRRPQKSTEQEADREGQRHEHRGRRKGEWRKRIRKREEVQAQHPVKQRLRIASRDKTCPGGVPQANHDADGQTTGQWVQTPHKSLLVLES
jgi:hypothetical protein